MRHVVQITEQRSNNPQTTDTDNNFPGVKTHT